jgi:hypothetical protein
MRRTFRASLFLLLFLVPGVALASVEITDVVYDVPGSDAGHEWVEVTNKGSAGVDLSGFKFLEGGVKHKLTLEQGSAVLAPGASAAIVTDLSTFLLDHPGFPNSVYKSSFSLSNTGETLALVNASGAVEHTLTYKGAPAPPKTAGAKASSKSSPAKSSPPGPQAAAAAQTDASTFTAPGVLPGFGSPLWVWYAALGAVIALGIAGVALARPFRAKELETKGDSLEFEIQ